MTETQQRLKFRVETLEEELSAAHAQYGDLRATMEERDRTVRAPEDVQRIGELEQEVAKAQDEASYLRQELIEARARKSASDDELGTVRGKLETLQNTITSLSEEGTAFRTQIGELNKQLDARTREVTHLQELVARMEASATDDEVIRTQMEDLRTEVANSEGEETVLGGGGGRAKLAKYVYVKKNQVLIKAQKR